MCSLCTCTVKSLIITDIIFEHAVHTQGGQFPVWLSYLPTPFQKKTGETTTITQNMQKHENNETTYEICKRK